VSTSMTLLQLRTAARQRADQENASGDYSDAFIKDSELTSYINQSAFELYDLLITLYGNDYFLTGPYTINSDGVNDSFALPSDFYKAVSVSARNSSSAMIPLRQASFSQMMSLQGTNDVSTLGLMHIVYRLRSDKLWFAPKPQNGQSFYLYYIPRLQTLSADSDTFDGISGWTEYIIVDAAIKCMQKEESDVSVLLLQKEALLKRIASSAENRDAAAPSTISDVLCNRDPFGWWGV
jgi:hypothetical protein